MDRECAKCIGLSRLRYSVGARKFVQVPIRRYYRNSISTSISTGPPYLVTLCMLSARYSTFLLVTPAIETRPSLVR